VFLRELYRVTDVKHLAFLKPATASCGARGAIDFSREYGIDRILEHRR